MPQSLSQVILHVVFSTKDRRPWLDPGIRPRLHAYLATVCRDCDCPAYRVGGAADHVHIATRLARTVSQAELLEKIKKTSSAWIKTQRQFMMELEFRGIRQAAPLPMPQLGSEVFTSPASDTERLVQGGVKLFL
jgi:REP element-mobilizing transposase RayT